MTVVAVAVAVAVTMAVEVTYAVVCGFSCQTLIAWDAENGRHTVEMVMLVDATTTVDVVAGLAEVMKQLQAELIRDAGTVVR